MPDIFLSYSREDQATARRFADALERAGFSVWWDQALNAGESFDQVTEQALAGARAVVVLWSPRSVNSRWVRAEAAEADENRTLVPVLIEPCAIPIKFKLTQTADLAGWQGDAADPRWLSFAAGLRRLAGDPAAAPPASGNASSPPPATARSSTRWWIAGVATAAAAIGGAWFWHARSVATTNRQPSETSIAVLPFVNMSSDPEQEYFSDGLTEELLNQLAQVPQLRVIGRTSSFAFKGKTGDLRQIGRTLGANHLLEGSVRKAGDRIKITAQLIDARDGSHLWSETYERRLDDVFAIQDEISRTVAEQLRLKLDAHDLNAGGTKNVAAWDEFLAAKAFLNSLEDSMVNAVPRLERALELDPNFMTARLWLIDAYMRKSLGEPADRAASIKQEDLAIDEVLRQSANTPEASFALSYRAARGRDLVELERLMKDAMRIPGYTGDRARVRYGQFLMGVGRFKDALPIFEGVLKNDPLDGFTRVQMWMAAIGTGDLARADREIEQSLQTPGIDRHMMYQQLYSIAEARKDTTRMRQLVRTEIELQTITEEQGKLTLQALDQPDIALRALRQKAAATQLRGDIYLASNIAQNAATLGDRQLALRSLAASMQSDFSFDTVAWILWKLQFRDLWGEPAFRRIVADTGLVDYWRRTGNWGDFCKPVGSDDFECR